VVDPLEAVRARVQRLDDRSISDEARRWAADELRLYTPPEVNPETRGAWISSLEIAFEAGRILGRSEATRSP